MRFGIREFIFVTLMLALLGSSWYFVFKRSSSNREKKLTEIKQMDRALANLHTATAGIADLNHKINDLQKAIDFFASKLPAAKEMDNMLSEFSQMADANSLQSKAIKSLKTDRGSSFSEQSIQVNLSGDFNGFYSFLLQLEKLPRITRITNMNLQKALDRDGEMQATMTMSIFFEPDATLSDSATSGKMASGR